MDGIRLKFEGSTLTRAQISDREENLRSVVVQGWVYVRVINNLLAFQKDGENFVFRKKYENIFEGPNHHRYFPWTVIPSKPGNEKVLVVWKKNGLYSHLLTDAEAKAAEKIDTGDSFVADSDDETFSVSFLTPANPGEVFVKIVELTVPGLYRIDYSTKEMASVDCDEETLTIPVLTNSSYKFLHFKDDKLVACSVDSDLKGSVTTIANGISGDVPSMLLNAYVTKLGKSELFIFASEFGLYTYKLEAAQLKLIDLNQEFSTERGWTEKHWESMKMLDGGGVLYLVFSGPNGIGIYKIDGERPTGERRILDTVSAIDIKHASLLAASSSATSTKIVLLVEYGNLIASVIATIEKPVRVNSLEQSKDVVPSYSSMVALNSAYNDRIIEPPNAKRHLWLGETLDTSAIDNGVDCTTGQLSFSLPIIDLRSKFGVPLKHTFYYDQPEQVEEAGDSGGGVLGRYWSRSADFIYVDRKEGVFEEQFEYFLVSDKAKMKLEWVEGDGKKEEFKFDTTKATYHKDGKGAGRWEVVTEELSCTYGGDEGAVRWTLGWPNWNGRGSDREHVERRPLEWYLSEAKTKVGDSVVKYEYDSDLVNVGKASYTRGIYIKKITDKAVNLKINFNYDKYSDKGSDNDKSMNVVFEDYRYLVEYNIEINGFVQKVTLGYDKKFLNQITDNNQVVMQFSYKNLKLKDMVLPTGQKLEYTYKDISIQTESVRKSFKDGTFFFSGPSYSIAINVERNTTINMQILDSNAADNFVRKSELKVSLPTIKNMNVMTQSEYFIVHARHEKQNTLVAFMKGDSDMWSEGFNENYNTIVDITLQNDQWMLLHRNGDSDPTKLSLFKANKNKNTFDEHRHNLNVALDFGSIFIEKGLIYTKKEGLFLVRYGRQFTECELLKQDFISKSFETLDKFYIPQHDPVTKEDIDEYKRGLKDSALRGIVLWNNVLFLRELIFDNKKLSSRLHRFVLDNEYKIASTDTQTIDGIDLGEWELKKTFELDNSEHTFTFTMKQDNNDWKLDIKQHDTRQTKNKDEIAKLVLSVLKIPLDFEQMNIYKSGDAVICSNTEVTFDGHTFKTKKLDLSEMKLEKIDLQIARNIRLQKKGDKISLVNTKKSSQETKVIPTNRLDYLQVKLPYYVGFKIDKERFGLYKLENAGTSISNQYNIHGSILKFSTETLLITRENSQVFATPIRAINEHNKFNVNVIKTEQKGNTKTSYDHVVESAVANGNSIAFKKVKIIPNGDNTYGYYEQTSDFASRSRSLKVFDSKNNIVIENYKGARDESDESKPLNESMVLFDKFGRQPIVDFNPYRLDSKQVDFIGFEWYEDIEKSKRGWNIDAKKIVMNQFAGTGNSFYVLNKGDVLQNTVKLQYFTQTHVVSSWVRVNKGLALFAETNILTVTVTGTVQKAIIKDQINEWFYAEVLLVPPENSFQGGQQITMKFNNANQEFVHIDHIRLSPLEFAFKAAIYDGFLANPTAVLGHNGRVVRYLYDDYGRKIGQIDENGKLEKLMVYSKKATNDGSSISSMINLQPVAGFLERMSPYTIGLVWKFEVGQWKFWTNTVSHSGSTTGRMVYLQSLDNCSNIGLRFMLKRSDSGNLKIKFSDSDTLNLLDLKSVAPNMEVVIVRYQRFVSIWNEGKLVNEKNTNWSGKKQIVIEVEGDIELRDLIILEDVDLLIEYNDEKGQPIQQISVEDSNHIAIRGFVYDAVQRETVETVWTRYEISKLGTQILHYRENFVNLSNDKVTGSVVKDTKSEYQDFPFTRIKYVDCPVSIRSKVGQPGKDNNINSNRAISYSKDGDISFLKLIFPANKGFRYETQHLPNKAEHTEVFDNQDRKVAEYVAVPKYDNILTTYSYDEVGNQVEMLPPNFYKDVDIRSKTEELQTFLNKADDSIKNAREKWRMFKTFDTFNQETLKETPDSGKYELFYNTNRQLRYVLHYNKDKRVDKAYYHKYTPTGEMFQFGMLETTESSEKLKSLTKKVDYPDKPKHYIEFDYGELDAYPSYRNRKESSYIVNSNERVPETLYFDNDGNVLRRSYVNPSDANHTLDISFSYEKGHIKDIVYPLQFNGSDMILRYTYNFKGQVIAVGTRSKPNLFAKITHEPSGKVKKINFSPERMNAFSILHKYDAAGNMIRIESEFLDESLDYSGNKGYNRNNEGDGSVLRTTFQAKWHEKCNKKLLKLSIDDLIASNMKFEKASKCFQSLKEKKFIDDRADLTTTLRVPVKDDYCFSDSMIDTMSTLQLEKEFPQKYGHAYDYGSHGEMTIAKYFTNNEDPSVDIRKPNMEPIANPCAGDVESFDIDPNGNHRLFYTGNKRYKFEYESFTNMIKSVKVGGLEKEFHFTYNSEGSVTSANYKNIITLEYDRLLDRVSKITMADGTQIQLGYDVRGERNFKRVISHSGKQKETYYIRDIKGRCLIDVTLLYAPGSKSKPLISTTVYIYGPLGLLGFIRNDVFYSVIADHEGSTRLVVKNGEVVAAYDYLPYGQRLRFYNSDPDGHIVYQYTGQEHDEETGLYNYHARLYDPELGRFYQIDPKEQYPSPYKYAGNSPVMMVDPDGELAFFIVCVVFSILGAYLAASAASSSWNPLKWKWGSLQFWVAMIAGAFAGAMLPMGASASFGAIASIGGMYAAGISVFAIAAAGAYLGMAGASNDWNPANWDFTSPALYSGLLNGVSLVVNIPSGIVGVSRTMATFTTAKTMYGAAIVGGSIVLGYGSGVMANNNEINPAKWNWNARTIMAIFEGSTTILMATSAVVKHGPKKALLPKNPPNVPKTPSTRWVKKFKHSECRWDAYNDGFGENLAKARHYQMVTGVKKPLGPMKPPPGMTKEFVAGLPTVQQGFATVAIAGLLTGENYVGFRKYFADLNPIKPNVTNKVKKRTRREIVLDELHTFSSASRPNGYLGRILGLGSEFSNDYSEFPKIDEDVTNLDHLKQPSQNKINSHSFGNCFAAIAELSAFTCYQPHGKVLVFPRNPSSVHEPESTPIDQCLPFHWYDQPSVGCEGQEFAFIYTPYEKSRIFSFLDGWLLLARVGLEIVRKPERSNNEKNEKVVCNEKIVSKYAKQLKNIETLLESNSELRFDWARLQLAEMRDDLKEFSVGKPICILEKILFEEKLYALEEDIREELTMFVY